MSLRARSSSLKRMKRGVSLPSLAHIAWAVEEQDPTGHTRSAAVVLQLDVVQNQTRAEEVPECRTVKVVLGWEQMEAMIRGMHNIAEGLDAIA